MHDSALYINGEVTVTNNTAYGKGAWWCLSLSE